jgi:hypothetical protein
VTTPTANGVSSYAPPAMPASVSARSAAAIAKWENRSVWTRKRCSTIDSGSKPRTSPATRSGRCPQPSRVTRSRALMPSAVDFQKVSAPTPLGATTPMPVTTGGRPRRLPWLIVHSRLVG